MSIPKKLEAIAESQPQIYASGLRKGLDQIGAVLYCEQDLTDDQQAQARDNIGAGSAEFLNTVADELSVVVNDFWKLALSEAVRYDTEQALTDEQKVRVRENIGAADKQTFNEAIIEIASSLMKLDRKKTVLYSEQELTDEQKEQARQNIGAAAVGEGGGSADGAVLYTEQTLTDKQKTQARENIGASAIDDASIGLDAWSSKNIVDKLCPSFTESGAIIACEPIEGYPLTVTTDEGATTITHCGKNLWDLKSGVSVRDYISANGTPGQRYGYDIELPPGTYTAHAEPLIDLSSTNRYMYGYILNKNDRTIVRNANLIVGYTKTTQTFTLAEGQLYMLCHGYAISGITQAQANKLFDEEFNVQIELGSAETPYEPYKAEVVDPADTISAWDGVNTIYPDTGNITVTGKTSPFAVMEKLTNAIVSLGSNV